jgi:putative transcriptional regulator
VTISHHLDDATLVAYASGNLAAAHGILVEAHVAMCGQCRAGLRQAESLGGAVLADQEDVAVTDLCRSATLASLDAILPQAAKAKQVKGELPLVLSRLLDGKALDDLHWKKKAPGVSMFDIPLSKGSKTHLKLLSIKPGAAMPEHGHGGEEITLILKGAYRDHMGLFQAGDVADLDEDIEHTPVVVGEVACICLVALEAPTRFKSFWARLAQPFVGI